ncbi:MAG: acetyltransferase [Candidatus Omnitrophota bacterium]|nr:MAG: acetyltransferase [Candidatus Omnitrophota bacterium]
MKEEIILIGGGGHCKACIDVIEAEKRFKIAGIVDSKKKVNQKVLGYKIIASDEEVVKLAKEYRHFLITIGQIKSVGKRIEKFEHLKKIGVNFPIVVSPFAYVSKYSRIEEGTIIMHKAFVNSDAKIGKNCIINTGAIIEHEASIGDHCHISTNSVINGQCSIGSKTFIGSNCVIVNNINIPENTVIGAGSAIKKSIGKSGIYVGNLSGKFSRECVRPLS